MTTAAPASAEDLHAQMVQTLIDTGSAYTEPVIEAFREVDRRAFLPGAPLQEAYNPHSAAITKRAADGRSLSCASVATLVAKMLEHLQVRRGDNIFECGAGTGFNAALMAYLTGPEGHVITVDIDEEVTDGASRNLGAAGYGRVHVITRDGVLGAPEDGPFDRAIAAVGVWDLSEAWFRQLKPGARMVVPLRWRGQTRGVAFDLGEDGVLRSAPGAVFLCGFVPMIGQDGEITAPIHQDPEVNLHYDVDQGIDSDLLRGVLSVNKTPAWSGVMVGSEDPLEGIWLRATATDPAVCRIEASNKAVDTGLCTPTVAIRSPALVVGASLAYLAHQRVDGPESRFELGAIGHGPDGRLLADRLCDHIRTWNTDRNATPTITATLLIDNAPPKSSNTVIVKEFCALTVQY